MFLRIRLKSVILYFISWKTLFMLSLITFLLLSINIALSWWIQAVKSKVAKTSRESVFHNQPSGQETVTVQAHLLNLMQWSVLDSSGEYKFYVGILQAKTSLDHETISNDVSSSQTKENKVDLTLVTQCSLSRLHMLLELAKWWQGPISVAVFLLPSETELAIQLLLLLHHCLPDMRTNVTFSIVMPLSPATPPDIDHDAPPHSCNSLLPTLARFERQNYDFWGISYPNNLMRNVARQAVRSHFIMVLDIDILPSAHLRLGFLSYIEEYRLLMRKGRAAGGDDKTVWVVPAYEIDEGAAMPPDKESLLRLRQSGLARPFYQELCWKCQKYTEYEAWEKQAEAGDGSGAKVRHLYEVLWRDPWEPFFVAKATAPAYDERFRQYGFNRISQVCELHVAGYRFLVLDSAFVVHRGFKRPGFEHRTKGEEQERNRILFRQFKTNLKEKYPESSRRCY